MYKRLLVAVVLSFCMFFGAEAFALGILVLPANTEMIEKEAFVGINADEVVLPEGVKSIGARAFADGNISKINLPASLEQIADDAFEGINNIDIEVIEGTWAYDWAVDRGFITVIPKPPLLTAAHGIEGINVEWSEAKYADGYILYYAGDDGVYKEYGRYSKDVLKATIYGVDIYSEYAVKMASMRDNQISYDSDIIIVEAVSAQFVISDGVLKDYKGKDENVIIPPVVNSIAHSAFSNNQNIKSVIIPECVQEIEYNAFVYCYNLERVVLPDGLKSIGEFAFGQCFKLSDVTIPSTVTKIERDAFAYCKSLTSISIPASVMSIGVGTFSLCSNLKAINVSSQNTYYISIDGVLFEKNNDVLVNYPAGAENESYIVPDSVIRIEERAFFGAHNIKSLTMSNSVTSIGEYGLAWCENLENVILSDALERIGERAFEDCHNLRRIHIPNSVTYIGSEAFRFCNNMTEVILSDSLTYIDDGAFKECSGIKSIDIPDSVTYIGYEAFAECTNLTSVSLSKSLTGINDSTFYACNSLASIVIPDSITFIEQMAFAECSSLTSVQLSNSLTSIGESSFSCCSSLKEIDFPESVRQIRVGAFACCTSLTNVIIPDTVTDYEKAFAGCSSLVSIILPNTITSIGWYEFSGCSSLLTLEIPASVTRIDPCAFDGCSSLKSVNIPEAVTEIGSHAFYNCTSLTNILIPDSVESIGSYAFSGCSSLTEINIPESITAIESGTFYGCASLKELIIPDSVTNLGLNYHNRCYDLVNIRLPNSVTSISAHEFEYYYKLTTVTLPSSLTTIGDYAFHSCSNLTNINIPDSLLSIGKSAFSMCSKLQELIIPDSITYLGEDYHYECVGLINIRLPNSVASIKDNEFSCYDKLMTVDLPDTITRIGSGAFSGCTSLTNITIPSSTTDIGLMAFDGCTSLTNIVLPETLTRIQISTFRNCISLVHIDIPTSVKAIEGHAFQYCENLNSIRIPESVEEIGGFVFFGCSSLRRLTMPTSVNSIDSWALNGTSLLLMVYKSSYAAQWAVSNNVKYIVIDDTGLYDQSIGIGESISFIDDTEKAALYTWYSSDSSVASVDENGVVTGIAIGKATISCQFEDYTDTCEICVIDKAAWEEIYEELARIKVTQAARFLLNCHWNLLTTEYNGKTIEQSLHVNNGLGQWYYIAYETVLGGGSLNNWSETAETSMIIDALEKLAPTNILIRLNDIKDMLAPLGLKSDTCSAIVALLESGVTSGSATISDWISSVSKSSVISSIQDVSEELKTVSERIGNVLDAYDCIVLILNFVGDSYRYTHIDKSALNRYAESLQNSDSEVVKSVGYKLSFLAESDARIIGFTAETYAFDVVDEAWKIARNKVIGSYPWGAAAIVTNGLVQLTCNFDGVAAAEYHIKAAIDIADKAADELNALRDKFNENPAKYYKELVEASMIFGRLVTNEWAAIADLDEAMQKGLLTSLGSNVGNNWDDLPGVSESYTLKQRLDEYYDKYLASQGVAKVDWPDILIGK